MNDIELKQQSAIRYYNRFSTIYDLISSKSYYHKSREFAIEEMDLKKDHLVLNIPCGTGQNFEYFQEYLSNTGKIVGIDLSKGMLEKAIEKVKSQKWTNIQLINADATTINEEWIMKEFDQDLKFESILCDLGLSGFPNWKSIIDSLLLLLKPGGKIVIMDWYIEKPSLRGWFIKLVGKGEVNRPIYQYLESRVSKFKLNKSFKNGQMFVATGARK